jgi:hypothetical protein
MRGEGTCAAVSRSTPVFNARQSCTVLFHHGDTEPLEKIKKKSI